MKGRLTPWERLLSWLREVFAYHWGGPPGLPGSLRLEWRFVTIRWVGIAAVGPGLLLAHLTPRQMIDAYAVLAVAAIYNIVVLYLVLRHPSLVVSGYLTMVGDALLNIAMVTAGGGFNSPMYYLLYTVTISAAMRYGYAPGLLTAGMFATFDVVENLVVGIPPGGPFFFRNGFLAITAILAGYLREQAQHAEAALERRLHQANRLNEATALLGASLDLDDVLQAVTNATCRLYDGDGAVLFPGAGLLDRDAVMTGVPWVNDARDPSGQLLAELHLLAARAGDGFTTLCGELGPSVTESGRKMYFVDLIPPARPERLATLAVVGPPDGELEQPDPDIIQSFVERVALAVEKALLYRALAARSSDLQHAYADLARAHDELVRVDEMKTNFLANVSHEIRTPLSSIRSFSEILLTYGTDSVVQNEFLTIINSESERLTRLLNDVLDVTKIESGRVQWHMEPLDLGSLLEETARTYAIQAKEAGLTFHYEVEARLPAVNGDRDRLQQVLGNLLNNAVKFTRVGTITLRARSLVDEVHISVSDTGIGIAPRDHERIFDKFEQVGEVMTDKPKGTGLGLSICREIVDHHGGRIWVESEKGKGSTFTFSLIGMSRQSEQHALAGAVG